MESRESDISISNPYGDGTQERVWENMGKFERKVCSESRNTRHYIPRHPLINRKCGRYTCLLRDGFYPANFCRIFRILVLRHEILCFLQTFAGIRAGQCKLVKVGKISCEGGFTRYSIKVKKLSNSISPPRISFIRLRRTVKNKPIPCFVALLFFFLSMTAIRAMYQLLLKYPVEISAAIRVFIHFHICHA